MRILYYGDINHFRHMVMRKHYWVLRRGIGLWGVCHTMGLRGYFVAVRADTP